MPSTFQPRHLPLFASSLLTLVASAVAQAPTTPTPATQPLPEDRRGGAAAVSLDDCKKWLYTLASREFEGRQTGTPGYQKAADYVTAHFKALGLEARGDNGTYFQTVPWTTAAPDPEQTFVRFHKDGTDVLRIPADRLTGRATADSEAAGDAVLLVVAAPDLPEPTGNRRGPAMPAIDGLADLDVTGKVVVLHIVPNAKHPNSAALTRFAVQRELSGKSPAALVMASSEAVTGGLRGRSGPGRATGRAITGGRRNPLDATFGGEDFQKVLAAVGLDAASAAPTQPPQLRALGMAAQVSVKIVEKEGPAMNVWAVLPGSDPKLKDEYVVIGSHLDHVGYSGFGSGLHPGADDDASGTTGVLAVATMFVKNQIKPRRSILFVCFAGEEDGLVGSRFFAQNPPIPLESIVAELQMDMIGRDEEENREGDRGEKAEDNRNTVHLVGTQKLAPALHELCLAKNARAGLEIEYDQEGMFGRSDHANFARMGVPIAFFFTGLHRDYHEPTDTPDKIHFEKLLRIATWVYDIGFELGTQDGRPEVDPKLWDAYRGKGRETPAAPLLQK
jgi:hypothetical protein